MATTTAWLVLRAAATTDGYYYKCLPYRISRGARSWRVIFYCISRGAQTRTHVKYDTEWLTDCGPHVKYDTEWLLLRAAITTTLLLLLPLLLLRTGARRSRELRHPEEITRNGHRSRDIPTNYVGRLTARKNEHGS